MDLGLVRRRVMARLRRRLPQKAVADNPARTALGQRDRIGTYGQLAALGERYGPELVAAGDLACYERKVFSQNGEDGVTCEILHRIGVTERCFVEFGAGTGAEGCCVVLADVFGWSGLFIEADESMYDLLSHKYGAHPRVDTLKAKVTAENVEALFARCGVPSSPDVLSIDIDSNDYWVWEALERFRPRLIIIEYNANLPVGSTLVRAKDESQGWDETAWFSASIAALEELARKKGYALVHTDLSGVNAFFVRDDLAERVQVTDVVRRAANYGLVSQRLPDALTDHEWVDVGGG